MLEKREKNIAPGTSGSKQAQIAEVGLSPQTVSNIMNIVDKFNVGCISSERLVGRNE